MTTVINNLESSHPQYIKLKQALKKQIEGHTNNNSTPSLKYIFSNTTLSDTVEHLKQLVVNMERWRRQPHNMPQPYIMINIADFTMNVTDSEKNVLNMKIIVGKYYTRTPLFHSTMTYLVLNPFWEIPPKIARNEILPEVRKNKKYLAENNMEIYDSWDAHANKICPDSVHWDSLSPGKLIYHFRQLPGPQNALGHIKFMLPNKYDVYLHDTPFPQLFSK